MSDERQLLKEDELLVRYLDKMYQCIITVRTTCMDAKKAFLTAGNFCTKMCSRFNNSSIEACFLCLHFKDMQLINLFC